MKILNASAEILFPTDKETIDKMVLLIEQAARTCYKTDGNMVDKPNYKFIRDKIDRGHLSVIEHSMVTVKMICDRGVTHEMVRHRLASYSQESTRYCNYSHEKFDNDISCISIVPAMEIDQKMVGLKPNIKELILHEWMQAMLDAEMHYFKMLDLGATPQIARSVLPNSTKAEIIVTANLREWRHICSLRTSKAAHPQMQEIMIPLVEKLNEAFPTFFSDIRGGY